jgi:uncharacterized membrane protein YbjE (DUF340 family)
MFVEIGYLAVGTLLGYLLRNSKPAQSLPGRAMLWTIYALLFILGAKLGGDQSMFQSLGLLGAQGLTIGLCCLGGSVLCTCPARAMFQARISLDLPQAKTGLFRSLAGSMIILGCFCLGILAARLGLPAWLYQGDVSLYILWALLFFVGMGMGYNLATLLIVRELGFRVLLVPLLTFAGTCLGAVLAFFLLDLDMRSVLAAGFGFGYYSLTSVMVTEMHSAALGSIALLANVFRELFTLVATPLLVRLFGPIAPMAACGAPAMDDCLPVIIQFTGERYGFISLFTGLVLTIAVPFLVPFVLTFGT